MTKKEFILELKKACVNLDHISTRKLDYKFHEYLLFKKLSKYDYEEFKVLGLPDGSLDINYFATKDDYSIHSRTHVTLNYEIYKLFECGYYVDEAELVETTLNIVRSYQHGCTIKDLSNQLRKIRIEFCRCI